jgi:branched-chain amino acid transport system substrate-binding protein
MQPTRLRALAALVAAALLLVAAPRARAADAAIEIPAVLPLTGGLAYSGQTAKASLAAFEEMVNKSGGIHGMPIKFVYFDDQGSPQIAVQVTQQAMANKPVAIVGSEFVALCQAMEAITRGKTVQYCISPGVHPAYGSDMFSASIATDGMATAMIRFMREKGWKRVATITSTDASGQDAETQLKTAVAQPENAGGVTIVDAEHFNPSDVTVLAEMQRIRAATPDAVVMWTSGAPFGTVVRGFADAGINVPAFTTNANLSYTFMKQFANYLPKQLYFPSPPFLTPEASGLAPGVRSAIAKFSGVMKAAHIAVDFQAGNPWDPPALIVDGLRHLGPHATSAQLHDWIMNVRGWSGICGVYDFSNGPGAQRGLTVKDTLIVRWDAPDNTWVPVSRPGGRV